ncbi:hypothetical protein Tco_0573682 [Tanacetum coccineum]
MSSLASISSILPCLDASSSPKPSSSEDSILADRPTLLSFLQIIKLYFAVGTQIPSIPLVSEYPSSLLRYEDISLKDENKPKTQNRASKNWKEREAKVKVKPKAKKSKSVKVNSEKWH